ncbi:MAG: type VI secretion system Vgr family protein [Wenzhouxiangella sp.]
MSPGLVATQANRQARFHCPLPLDDLMLNDFVAREKVSGLFEYELVLSSEDENIDFDALVGQPARVELDLRDGSIREFNGVIIDFTFAAFRDNLAEYRAVLRPWFWLLTQASNNRIFQNQTVPQIIEAVCADHGFTDIVDRLSATYEARDYCVQYRESDFAFLSRLMEEEGIYYYFEHGSHQHNLVLADDISAHSPFPNYEAVRYYPPDEHQHRAEEHLDSWTLSRSVRTGNYRLTDFDFKTPRADLEVVASMEKAHANAGYERYDYPGQYNTDLKGNALARSRLEQAQSDHEILCGRGNARGMAPGHLFDLEQFPRGDQNRRYLILEVTHRLRLGGLDSGGQDEDLDFEYDCHLTAMPASEPFRPAQKTEKPVVFGPQTAIVVGQSGEEITTDQYGRIKVKFHWDRDPARNQNSSCWVRVSQAWAGNRWGAQFIPRIGQEVIVEFLEGDPDRPIVTGSVYNADNMPPYDLPANATQSGVKTRSSKGGTTSNFNEIRFEDKKGAEELNIHAEKDMKVEVENDRTEKVGNDERVTIQRDRHHTIENDDARTVKGKDTEEIAGQQKVTIDGGRNFKVKQSEIRDVGMSQTENIGLFWKKDVTGNIDITSAGNINIIAGGNAVVSDSNHVDISAVSWGITGTSGSITGVALGLEGTNNALKGQTLTVTGVNIGVDAVGIGFKGLDSGVTGAELKKTMMETKQTALKLSNAGIVLKAAATSIGNGAISLKNKAMTIFS